MHTFHSLKEGAIFIADSHINEKNQDKFLIFLDEIKKLNPPQLFLMGDIFDLLVGGVKSTIDKNKKVIQKIDELAKDIETFYFTGNHDFNLKDIFKNVKVFERYEQPQIFSYEDKKIALAHGDLWTTKSYEIYIKTLQNRYFLKFITFLNEISNNFIVKKICKYNSQKNLCKKIENFKSIAKKRVKNYKDVDVIIEGHFHQNVEFDFDGKRYVNLPSWACGGRFAIFEESFIG